MADHEPPDLTEYRRKRRPDRSPEPFVAGAPSPADAPIFVVHRHSARRLHYDLRLERGGALASWAVPKGVPMVPGARHLAVHVEDHPLEYGGFEGSIPAGEYGAGTVEIWDTGTHEVLEDKPDGGLSVRLSGRRLQGIWELVPARLGGEEKNWLIIRKNVPDGRDWSGGRPAPMLATLVPQPPSGDGWVHEIKWDGFRTLTRIRAGEPEMWSRRGQDLTARFAQISRALPRAVRTPECVLDGEVCALDEAGRPGFGLLQRGEGTLVYYVFDILELEGESLTGHPWRERRDWLESLVVEGDAAVRISPLFPDGAALLRASAEQRLEGTISKRADSPYRPGRRSSEWQKAKVRHRRRLAVAGYRRGQGGRDRLGALILALEGPGGWEWAGNCGSGLGDAEIDDILARLEPLRRTGSPLAHLPDELRGRAARAVWAEPRLICEVEFIEWTDEGRLRAPVFLGLVADPDPDDARRRPEDPPGTGAAPGGAPAAGPRDVAITRPDKVYFPADGITKGDLIAYYRAVAPVLIPHLRDRPLTLMRHPHGIDGEGFVQKDRPPNLPDWIPVAALPAGTSKNARTLRFVLANEPDALVWLVNAGCVDMNAWYSRAQHPRRPDFMLFDLDPSDDVGMAEALRVALLVRDALALMGLRAYAKTLSARGVHVMAPLDPVHEYAEVRGVCKLVASALERTHPGLVTTTWAKDRRRGVLIDCNQVGYGRTISSVYSVRPRPGAPVSTPLTWDEVAEFAAGADPGPFTMDRVLERISRGGDIFAPVVAGGQRLDDALARVRGEA